MINIEDTVSSSYVVFAPNVQYKFLVTDEQEYQWKDGHKQGRMDGHKHGRTDNDLL